MSRRTLRPEPAASSRSTTGRSASGRPSCFRIHTQARGTAPLVLTCSTNCRPCPMAPAEGCTSSFTKDGLGVGPRGL